MSRLKSVARYPYDDLARGPDFHDLGYLLNEGYSPLGGNWGDSWTVWQYTRHGGGKVNGIYTSGEESLDRNVYRGTINAMRQWAKEHYR